MQALGIEQWQPRALPAVEEIQEALAVDSSVVESSVGIPGEAMAVAAATGTGSQAIDVAEPEENAAELQASAAALEAPEQQLPARDQLIDRRIESDLARASVAWLSPPAPGAGLAVLGINAVGSELRPVAFDADFAVLQKMLTAIDVDITQCGVGGLSWATAGPALEIPYALILVDSGEDGAALISQWPGELLQLQGAQAVIAPHPRMFAQGTALKRQAWNSLQQLQKLWSR